jgi:hypothetical protein
MLGKRFAAVEGEFGVHLHLVFVAPEFFVQGTEFVEILFAYLRESVCVRVSVCVML